MLAQRLVRVVQKGSMEARARQMPIPLYAVAAALRADVLLLRRYCAYYYALFVYCQRLDMLLR